MVLSVVEIFFEIEFDVMEVFNYLGKSSFSEEVDEEFRLEGDIDWR